MKRLCVFFLCALSACFADFWGGAKPPTFLQFNAAVCQGGTAGTAFNTLAANAPEAKCATGTYTNFGSLAFDATTPESVQSHFQLPRGWPGRDLEVVFRWKAAATSGSVVWSIEIACTGPGETGDPAFLTPQTVTSAAQATAQRLNDATIAALTTTGCSPEKELWFRVKRKADDAGDDMTGDAELVWLRLQVKR
jgi:hypothetical protein